jgi:hypothetical protein
MDFSYAMQGLPAKKITPPQRGDFLQRAGKEPGAGKEIPGTG